MPYIHTDTPTVSSLISAWIDSFAGTTYLQQAVHVLCTCANISSHSKVQFNNSFYQVRFLTTGLGFPDDFYVAYSCSGDNAMIWVQVRREVLLRCPPYSIALCRVQSESRLGIGDFGVNRARVEAFLAYLSQATFTSASCS